jgi:hypothetical protein
MATFPLTKALPFQNRILQSQLEEARARATAAAAAAAASATAHINMPSVAAQNAQAYSQATRLDLDPVISMPQDAVVPPSRLTPYRSACQDLIKASQ